MKSFFGAIILYLFFSIPVYSQADSSSVYQNLETKKFYSVNLESSTRGSKSRYKVNGKWVTKATYDKYKGVWDNINSCCPCILKSYDVNDKLLRTAVACGDCGVGWFEVYFPNGELKLKGQYKENSTNDWNDINARGFCNVPDGKWIYYNKYGPKYVEIWNEGVFVKQIPDQKKAEIWAIEISLNDTIVKTNQILSMDDVKNLSITPLFKNSVTTTNLELKTSVSATGYKIIKENFTLDSLKQIDVAKMISDSGIPKNMEAAFRIGIYHEGKYLGTRFFKIK